MQKLTKSKILGVFVIAGSLFGSGAFAAGIFSANAEPWFVSKCVVGARGPVAAVCDLRERVIVLENSLTVIVPQRLIVRDADGEYVGVLVDGLPSTGTAYNEIENQFVKFETNGSVVNNELIGWQAFPVYFSSSDCSGQAYFDWGVPGDRNVIWSGSVDDTPGQYIYLGDGNDSVTEFVSGSHFQPAVAGCVATGIQPFTAFPVQEVIWTQSLDGPFVVELE
jgi:hypothetical protein